MVGKKKMDHDLIQERGKTILSTNCGRGVHTYGICGEGE